MRISGVFSMRQNVTHLRQALRSLRVMLGLAERMTAAPTSRIRPRSIPGSFGHSAKRDVSDCNASKRSSLSTALREDAETARPVGGAGMIWKVCATGSDADDGRVVNLTDATAGGAGLK